MRQVADWLVDRKHGFARTMDPKQYPSLPRSYAKLTEKAETGD